MDRHNNDHLGVNKLGKNIRKTPLHQPNFSNPARSQSQPQVYNINKNDFRNIVQQLTGSPSHHSQEPLPRPPHNPPKPPSMRLQKIRPPPLTPINRPQIPIHNQPPQAMHQQLQQRPVGSYNNNGNSFVRPGQFGQQGPGQFGQQGSGQFGQQGPPMPPPMHTSDQGWGNTVAESPISAYMRYLQHSIIDSEARAPQGSGQFQGQPQSTGLLPYPPPFPSPRMNGPPPLPSPRMNGPPLLSPRMINGPPPLLSPRMHNGPPLLPSPRMNGPPPLPSPTSQFLLSSPSGFLNMLSPRSPYAFLSPGYQNPPPFSPNFSFSSLPQTGLLGPGPQPPPSPGYGFPLSPSGFFPISSPRWRN